MRLNQRLRLIIIFISFYSKIEHISCSSKKRDGQRIERERERRYGVQRRPDGRSPPPSLLDPSSPESPPPPSGS